jgi:hypothetical protein
VEPDKIDKLDLENVVERQIAIKEGREPPPDTNSEHQEETPPREPIPPFPRIPPQLANSNGQPRLPPPPPSMLLRFFSFF